MSNYVDVTIMPGFVAFDGTPAVVGGRLINFPTGSAELQPGHKEWIEKEVVPAILARPNAWVDIFGFASKTGNSQANLELSKARANAVKNYIGLQLAMKGRPLDKTVNIEFGFGEDAPDYVAGESDNSPNWRAAQVTVFGSKPKIIRKPKPQIPKSTEFQIRVISGMSFSYHGQADNYYFRIDDLGRRRKMYFYYTGVGLAFPFPKMPTVPSGTLEGPPTRFTTSQPTRLYQFNSEASMYQDPGASFGSLSVAGTIHLAITKIVDGQHMIFTNPKVIPISGGSGLQLPGMGSATKGLLAKISDEFVL